MMRALRNDEALRRGHRKVAEPKAQAIFETTTALFDGLINAYRRYESELEEKARGLAA